VGEVKKVAAPEGTRKHPEGHYSEIESVVEMPGRSRLDIRGGTQQEEPMFVASSYWEA